MHSQQCSSGEKCTREISKCLKISVPLVSYCSCFIRKFLQEKISYNTVILGGGNPVAVLLLLEAVAEPPRGAQAVGGESNTTATCFACLFGGGDDEPPLFAAPSNLELEDTATLDKIHFDDMCFCF